MATQIVIANGDSILLDNSFNFLWADKGNAFPDIGNDIHYVVYNTQPGQDEVQRKDPSTLMMTGNTSLASTSSVVGNSVTVQDLLNWGETRKGQIESAKLDNGNYFETALTKRIDDGNNADDFSIDNSSATASYIDWSKTWKDYDENYS